MPSVRTSETSEADALKRNAGVVVQSPGHGQISESPSRNSRPRRKKKKRTGEDLHGDVTSLNLRRDPLNPEAHREEAGGGD